MKKTIIAISMLALIMLVVSSMPLSVKAHPGRTDGNGGHTNRSTGEYHYHHGYSAHDHYDMDGDGDVDCPYDFHDKTGASSGDGSGRSNISSGKTYNSNTEQTSTKNVNTVEAEVEKVPSWVYWGFGLQTLIGIALLFSNISKKDTINRMTYEYKNNIDILQKSCEEKLEKRNATDKEMEVLRARIAEVQKEKLELYRTISKERAELENIKMMRSRMKNAPLDVTFSKDGLPIYWKPNIVKPYGDYTVYVNKKSNIYHVDRLCASYLASEDHIFNVINYTRPCKKCADGFFDFTSTPDWFICKHD